MKNNCASFFRKIFSDQRGQSAVWIGLSLTAMLGLTGMSLDLGHAYVMRSKLQVSVNAAALSGASAAGMYNTGVYSAKTVATSYSSLNPVSGAANALVSTPCVNALNPGGTGCTNDSDGNANGTSVANAVRVKQTATVPMFFMRIFGVQSMTVGATATAADSSTQPWNVAIILDATGSMGNTDSYCSTSNTTAEQCAMNGIQTMLQGINPCYGSTTGCTSTNKEARFRVSFFSFPNVTTSTVKYDYCSGSGTPTPEDYTLPVIPATGSTTGYAPFGYTGTSPVPTTTYQITVPGVGDADANGFLSDYFSGGSLNPNSILVKIVGNGATKGCMKPPSTNFGDNSSGETYFASAIYAAQTALQAEKAAVLTNYGIETKNAIIFVSDGQANLAYGRFPQKTSNAITASGAADTYGDSVTYYKSSSSKYNLTGSGAIGAYPDYRDDCQQAIAAAQYARQQGTRVYAVAYGSEANGCTQDTTSIAGTMPLTLNASYSSASQVIPCLVMENIASPVGSNVSGLWYFYTDGSSSANGCTDTSHTSSNLNSIFGAISATFKTARLISNSVS